MILLWGHGGDRTLLAVYRALLELEATVAFFDQRRVLETEIHLEVSDGVAGALRAGEEEIDLAGITAAYIRPFDSRWLPEIERAGPGSAEALHALSVEDALTSWADICPAFVINRPAAIATNSSKPFQAAKIREHGFLIPETLVTTDPAEARAFWQKHESVIFKSVSAARSIVSRLKPEHAETLGNITWCPTQFQQYIPGNDYRVHVVGRDAVFACEILSGADDYRFAHSRQEAVVLRHFDLPEEIAERCIALASTLALPVAGIDLRCTPQGDWFCFEANPVAGFSYYQDACGHRIDEAVARLLLAAGEQISRIQETSSTDSVFSSL